MKRTIYTLAATLLLILSATPANAPAVAAENPTQWGNSSQGPSATVAPTDSVQPQLRPVKLREGLTRRQRRDMGLTFGNVRRVLSELQADESACFDDCCIEELAVMVAERVVTENPAAFQDPQLDWDAILAFIERLIPLIMTIISLFSSTAVDVDWIVTADVMEAWSEVGWPSLATAVV